MNDHRTKTIVLDDKKSLLVKEAFELYATGRYSLRKLREYLHEKGLIGKKDKPMSVSNIQYLLKNPIYYGIFRYGGEYYEGIHPPIITKQLFDKVQEVFENRHRATRKKKYEFAFRGFVKCGECGAMITAEIKKGKYRYYHCTKRKGKCSQPFNTTEESLAGQSGFGMSKIWLNDKTAKKIIDDFEKYRAKEDRKISGHIGKLERELKNTDQKLARLLSGYINGLISPEEYHPKKQKLVEQKIEIKEKLDGFSDKRTGWFELASDIINSCNSIKNVVEKNDEYTLKTLL